MINQPQKHMPPDIEDVATRHERDGWAVAISVTLLMHLFAFWLIPGEVIEPPRSTVRVSQQLKLKLEPPIAEEKEQEDTYVRAAPNVKDEVPEETHNVSDRNQVAAQPEESIASGDNTPLVDGDLERSNRIVQGDPREISGNPGGQRMSSGSGESPIPEQIPAPRETSKSSAPDFIEQEVETEDGIASHPQPDESEEPEEEVTPEKLRQNEVVSFRDGQGDSRILTPAQASETNTPNPRPRIKVVQDNSYGPIKKNRTGAIRIGNLSFDSRYSQFGDYWTRVGEIIEARWRNLVYNTRALPHDRGQVRIQFTITRTGAVEAVKTIYMTSTKLAETISTDAIVSEAPFFDWTPEMIVTMGERTECEITFFY